MYYEIKLGGQFYESGNVDCMDEAKKKLKEAGKRTGQDWKLRMIIDEDEREWFISYNGTIKDMKDYE